MSTQLSASFSFTEALETFSKLLKENMCFFGEKTPLRDACEYALVNGGKRIRPLIVMMMSEALCSKQEVKEAALSIEFFHTASLIADDLPCMDNDNLRREKPSTHKKFGETTTLLASYALITAGFEKIYTNTKFSTLSNKEEVCTCVLKEVAEAAGILGATGGQYLDLFPGDLTLDLLVEIIEKKTVKLFQVAFLYGWLFSGASMDAIEDVKKMGYHFGMAFQIADDLRDMNQDSKKETPINYAIFVGEEKATNTLLAHLSSFESLATKLGVYTKAFETLRDKILSHSQEK
ncbi:MAG: hypothetical protein S4CHLAM37_00310 [Chlamydiia bacterium]|nr:hypothetical protein [Chlamydiia bacterium]